MTKGINRKINYTEEQKEQFCKMAQFAGIGRAIRELGYPTHSTGAYWMKQRGIEPNANQALATARKYHVFYQTEDLLITLDNAMQTAEEIMGTAATADDIKKLADALYKIVQTRNLIEGKATAINEKRETTQADLEILELINIEKARNDVIEGELVEEVEYTSDIAAIDAPSDDKGANQESKEEKELRNAPCKENIPKISNFSQGDGT